MKNLMITDAQRDVLMTIANASKRMDQKSLVQATGRTPASLAQSLAALKRHHLLTQRGRFFSVPKAGQVALIGSQSVEKIESVLSSMTVDKIGQVSDDSLENLATVLKEADALPPAAVKELAQAVRKHGGELNWDEADVAIDEAPHLTKKSQFKGSTDSVLKWPKPKNFNAYLEVFSAVKIIASKDGKFGTGTFHLTSVHIMSGKPNDIFYTAAFNFEGKALKKAKALLKENDGMTVEKNMLVHARINYLKPNPKNSSYINAALYIDDFQLAEQ